MRWLHNIRFDLVQFLVNAIQSNMANKKDWTRKIYKDTRRGCGDTLLCSFYRLHRATEEVKFQFNKSILRILIK